MELRDFLLVLWKRRWTLSSVLAACLLGAAAATALATPMYEARAKLFVGQRQVATTELPQGATVNQLSLQLLKSYANIIRTRQIAERAVEGAGLPVAPKLIADRIKASPILDTQLIDLTFKDPNPAVAQRVVNGVANSFVAYIERIESPRQQTAEPAVRVSVVEPALRPEEPVSPRPVQNMALAFAVGLMLAVVTAMLIEYFDTSINGRDDVEGITGVPVLAAVPRVDTHGSQVYLERDSQSMGGEAFRKLRTAIQFLGVDHPVQSILVTSPFPMDGKTTVSLNLAAAFAQAGLRTVLVEADLRRPSLHKVFSSDGQRGLTTCLIGRIPLEQAILPTPIRNLSHIPAGAVPPNPTELLASEHMATILSRLHTHADIVIIDAPPLLPVADASALAPRTDGVVLVARIGKTERERLKEASGLVGKVGGRLLGVVLNYLRPEDTQYGYYQSGYPSRSDASFQTERGSQRVQAPKSGQAPAPPRTNR